MENESSRGEQLTERELEIAGYKLADSFTDKELFEKAKRALDNHSGYDYHVIKDEGIWAIWIKEKRKD